MRQIRQARLEDADEVMRVAVRAHRERPIPALPRIVTRHAYRSLLTVLQDPSKVCFFTPHAVLIGEINTSPFNFSEKVAQVVLLASDGTDGDRVLRAFIQWAQDHAATSVALEADAQPTERARKLYGRMAFCPIGTLWQRNLLC